MQKSHCAVIGTIGMGFLPNLEYTGYTTPDAIGVQKYLAECLKRRRQRRHGSIIA